MAGEKKQEATRRSKRRVAFWIAMAFASVSLFIRYIALPSLDEKREQARRRVCMSMMKGISHSCHFYANDHDGRFPPDLQTLIDEGGISELQLRCWRTGVAFVYVAGQTSSSDRRNVLLYDPRGNHASEGIDVLFADSRFERMSPAAFEAALAATKKRLDQR